MDYEAVPISWASMASSPYHRDPTSKCLPCQSVHRAPSPGTPAPPPAAGKAPCVACPNAAAFADRKNIRDTGPPCCVTETYGHSQQWPWMWGGESDTPNTNGVPELWQEQYKVKDRSQTGFYLSPTFNPHVL